VTTFYVDTSALAKRYLSETGSSWVRGWIAPAAGNAVVICELTPIEMFSLLERRRREGSLSATNAALLQSDFLVHAQAEYIVAVVDSPSLVHARTLITHHPLRALDAVQLACALKTHAVAGGPITFVSGDRNLLVAAAAEGLGVDDPNAHS
jgi:predicted nucleic acid-binding protein